VRSGDDIALQPIDVDATSATAAPVNYKVTFKTLAPKSIL
jgi:hypothetical protein